MPPTLAPFRRRAVHPLRILYADDYHDLRDFMQVFLTKAGHLIETVPDAPTALTWLRLAGPAVDLLITDHHMPRMNGLELVRRVRRLAFPGKIMVFSSELDETVHDAYRRLGVDLILPKPIFPSTLHHTLDNLFTPLERVPARSSWSRAYDLVLA